MRTSRSYQARYYRLLVLIDEATPRRRSDAAYDAGDFDEAERWRGLWLTEENIEMNFVDAHGHGPSSPADWKKMTQYLHTSLDMYGFEFRKGNKLVDIVAERAARYERLAR